MSLGVFLREEATDSLLPWASQVAAAERFGVTLAHVEEKALGLGLLPSRYQRNRETISLPQQLKLLRSHVVIVGCGGLGGYLIEELARLGIGRLTTIDPDRFEEHNLNRQLLSSPGALNRPKAEVAAERVRSVNPVVAVNPVVEALTRENGRELLAPADLVLDGLDTFSARVELAHLCREMGIPLVHGSIGGWYGQVASQLPGDDITPCFPSPGSDTCGVEKRLGNPSFTPAAVASLQVAEACKIILGVGEPLRRRMLFINLREMKIEEVRL